MTAPTPEARQSDRRQEPIHKKLHLAPTISWAHMLTTLALLVSVLDAWGGLNNRLTAAEGMQTHNKELISMQETRSAESRAESNANLLVINEKLDRLIERMIHVR